MDIRRHRRTFASVATIAAAVADTQRGIEFECSLLLTP
jgi:hypothetical protein